MFHIRYILQEIAKCFITETFFTFVYNVAVVKQMNKAKFIVDLILKLSEGKYSTPSSKLHDFKPEEYGLSRATAWRVFKELEECGYIIRDYDFSPSSTGWSLSPEFKMKLADIQVKRDARFWDTLNSILTFNDKTFEANIRRLVYKLLGKD